MEKKFRLVTTKSSNLVLFDPASTLKKYGSVAEILSEFYTIRLDYYGKRKQWLESKLELELDKLDNKVRFLMAVVDGQVVVQNRKKAVVIADLRQRGFREFSAAKDRKRLNETHLEAAAPVGEDDEEDEEDEEEGEGNAGGAKSKGDGKGYDYLLSMSLWSLTEERIRKLVAER